MRVSRIAVKLRISSKRVILWLKDFKPTKEYNCNTKLQEDSVEYLEERSSVMISI